MSRIRVGKMNRIVLFLMIINFSFCGSVSAEMIDRIVAIVDSDIVTLNQLRKETALYIENIEFSEYSDDKKQEMMLAINKKILNALIDKSLTLQEAKKYHINVSDSEIDATLKNVENAKSLTHEEFEKALEQEGLTLKKYRKNVKKQILQGKLIRFAVKSKVIITKSEIKKFYEANTEKYFGTKEYYLRNILMDNDKEIKEIKKKLDQKKDFIFLAKKYSIAPNAANGGNLGIFDINNFPKNIKDSIFILNKGEYTNVISTAQGFQIFYIENIVLKGAKTLQQAYDEIHEILYNEQVEKKFKIWLKSLKEKAHIKIML